MKQKHRFQKATASVLALCVLLAGCGKGAAPTISDSGVSAGTASSGEEASRQKEPSEGGASSQNESLEGVMVAQRADSADETNDAMRVWVMGDSIYTASWSYDWDAMKQTDCKVFLQQAGGEPELIAELEEQLNTILVGEDGAVYYLYTKNDGEEDTFYLRRDSAEGNTEYNKEILLDEPEKEDFQHLIDCAVSSQGELCFLGMEGGVYLFGADGTLLGMLENDWGEGWLGGRAGVVNSGGALYLYDLADDRVSLWPLDFAEGSIGRKEYLVTDAQPLALFSGYENGLYLSDEKNLWNYPPQGNSGTAVLAWNDSNVSLQPEYVHNLGILEGGSLFLLYWDTFTEKYAQAIIQEKKASEVEEKQKVLLGMWKYSGIKEEIEDAVMAFNRLSQDCQVELLVYDGYTDFYEDLLKGQGADLFELSGQSIQMLTGKGILEDLGPYFQQSESIQEEDLLPCIREAASVGGKMVCVIPAFYFLTMLTEKGVTKDGGWTVEDFLELGKANPGSMLTKYDDDPLSLTLSHLRVGMGNYIDWENKECHFDDPSFTALLETLKANSQKKYTGEIYETDVEKLFYKEELALMETVGSITSYLQLKEAFTDFGEIAGYPNLEGEPWYCMYTNQIYGMNSASKCKDGAWEFLEFLLGEAYQEQALHFPVMQEALERLFEKAKELTTEYYLYVNFYTSESKRGYPELTEEDKEFIRYMAEHARLDNSVEVRDIQEILLEELPYYFEGDKTAQEVAQVIQNRIGLYLSE